MILDEEIYLGTYEYLSYLHYLRIYILTWEALNIL